MSEARSANGAPQTPHSLWEATAGKSQTWPTLTTDIKTQVAIIGAGYTGLSAALHLAEAGIDTTIIDAQTPGWGASGRNGGQIIPGLKHDPDTLDFLFGQHGADIATLAATAPDLVFDIIDKQKIDCDATRTGWLQLAVSESTLKTVTARARQWQSRGAPVEILDRHETARLTGSSVYHGGLLDRRGGTLQPLAYTRGLANAAHRQGAKLFANTATKNLERAGAEWRIQTPSGSISAHKIILATNAYTDHLHDGLRRSIVAVPSFQIATKPLSDNLRRTILPEGQSVSDTRRLLRYFRLDRAGRLVMGARGAYGHMQADHAIRHHRSAVQEIFPQLADAEFPYRWGGMVAMTADHMPHLHELAPGLLTGLGYNGRGVAMATQMGRLLAAWAADTPRENLGFPPTPLKPIRLHRFSRLGVRLAIANLRLRDAIDAR